MMPALRVGGGVLCRKAYLSTEVRFMVYYFGKIIHLVRGMVEEGWTKDESAVKGRGRGGLSW